MGAELEDALGRLGQSVADQRARRVAERAAAWALIRAEAPEVAEMMTAFAGAFGRPAKVSVVIDGRRVL